MTPAVTDDDIRYNNAKATGGGRRRTALDKDVLPSTGMVSEDVCHDVAAHFVVEPLNFVDGIEFISKVITYDSIMIIIIMTLSVFGLPL